MTELITQDDLDRARFRKEEQEYLDARAAYAEILGQVSSTMPVPYSMQSSYGIATDGPQRASTDTWIREKHPDLAAAGARVVKEEQDYLALDEPVSSHAQPECSIAKYTSEKLYEYYAMAEMIYKLATDEAFRKQVAEKIGYFLTHGAIGNYLTANHLLDLADPLHEQMPDFVDYWLEDDAGDAALDKKKEELQAQIDRLESLAAVYKEQSFKQMGDYFKSMWEKFTKRFSECGLLYGISSVAVDGAFLVAEIGAGFAFLKGVKIVARAVSSGKMIAELVSVNGKTLGQAKWSKEALAAKYGEPDKIHVGGHVPDANRQIPDMPAEDVPRRGSRPGTEPEPTVPRRIRSREELLPDGAVPTASSGKFNSWWDDLSPDELDSLWADADIQDQIAAQVRKPGGMHEWLMVAEGPRLKRMGFSMDEIKAMTSPTRTLEGPYPHGAPGEKWRHSPERGGRGSGPNSGHMHNSLRDTIKSATNRNDLLQKLGAWSREWLDGGPDGFPPALRDAIGNAGY